MYLNFYKLFKKPFSLAPDPEFLYLSQQHKDALGAMIYGIKQREGFVLVVGEVGTGKTTVVRSYLDKASRIKNHPRQIFPIFIFNSKITFHELMKTFLLEIGIEIDVIERIDNLNDLVRLAYKTMLEKTKQGHNLVLIIDEAQNMPLETLGSLCVLSNFETSKAKLIQIVLVGQPELQKKLDLHELRQLRQRVAYRALITPLSSKESEKYVHHRLSVASREKSPTFTKNAIRKIVNHSKGVPRIINILCENALIAGYSLQKKPVTLKVVKQVIAEYEGRRFAGRLLLKYVLGGVVILLTMFLSASYGPFLTGSDELLKEQTVIKNKSSSHQSPSDSIDKNLLLDEKSLKEEKFAAAPTEALQDQTTTLLDESQSSNLSREHAQTDSFSPFTTVHYSTFQPSPQVKIAKGGDTLSDLCFSKYGFVNSRVLEWLKSYNPHISNIDEIKIGEIIFFPEMETPQSFQTASTALEPLKQY